MKQILKLFISLIICVLFPTQLIIAQSTVDPAQLVAALPKTIPDGFIKNEVSVNQTSPAQVTLFLNKILKKGTGGEDGASDITQSVIINISDETGNSEFTLLMIAPERNEEKAIKVKGKYSGKESVYKNDYGCVESNMIFLVNERFLFEIKGNNICETSLLYQIVDKMNLESLPK